VVASYVDALLKEDDVNYHFVRSSRLSDTLSQLLLRDAHRRNLYQPELRCIRLIKSLNPDVIHFFGTVLHVNLWLLLRSIRRRGTPVLLHHHGGRPSQNLLSRAIQRSNFTHITRFLVATPEHAKPFVDCKMIDSAMKVVPFISTSTTFKAGPKIDARAATGMHGDPVFVWTARLHPVKDPLTALQGFEAICRAWPKARLYMYYRSDELIQEVQRLLRERPILQSSVVLRGQVDSQQMEAIYRSADFFLQASIEEVSGFALVEAMACGAIPVVTNIPSFRKITDEGRAGILFSPGNKDDLADAVLRTDPAGIADLSQRVRAHFDQSLSFPALAGQLESIDSGILTCSDAE